MASDPDPRPARQKKVKTKTHARVVRKRLTGRPLTASQIEVVSRIVEGAFPDNWIDPILTGPAASLGKYPFGCPDIERVINAVKARLLTTLKGIA